MTITIHYFSDQTRTLNVSTRYISLHNRRSSPIASFVLVILSPGRRRSYPRWRKFGGCSRTTPVSSVRTPPVGELWTFCRRRRWAELREWVRRWASDLGALSPSSRDIRCDRFARISACWCSPRPVDTAPYQAYEKIPHRTNNVGDMCRTQIEFRKDTYHFAVAEWLTMSASKMWVIYVLAERGYYTSSANWGVVLVQPA